MRIKILLIIQATLILLAITTGIEAFAGSVYYDNDTQKNAVKEELLLLLMQETLIEGIEEAFAYPILNDLEEKEDHLKTMKKFDKLAARFRIAASIGAPGNEVLSIDFENVIVAKYEMQLAAASMFSTFESTKELAPVNVEQFEDTVDSVIYLSDRLIEDFIFKDMEGNILSDTKYAALLHLVKMRITILKAIEEAFAYTLLNNIIEKDDFGDSLKEFDLLAGEYKKLEYITLSESQAMADLYARMITAKERLAGTAKKMLDTFEMEGTVKPTEALEFENNIHEFTYVYNRLFDEFVGK